MSSFDVEQGSKACFLVMICQDFNDDISIGEPNRYEIIFTSFDTSHAQNGRFEFTIFLRQFFKSSL
jgi:hypothetical protein